MKQQQQNPAQRPSAGAGSPDENRLDQDRREGHGAFDDGLRDAQYGTRPRAGSDNDSGSGSGGVADAGRSGGAQAANPGGDRPDVRPGGGRQQSTVRDAEDALQDDPAAADLEDDVDTGLDDDSSVAGEEDPGAGPSQR